MIFTLRDLERLAASGDRAAVSRLALERDRLHLAARANGERLSVPFNVEQLKAKGSDAKARRTFKMAAYTGATFARMWTSSLTIDLAGIEVPDRLPMLVDHQSNPAGVAEGGGKLKDGALQLEGYLLDDMPGSDYVKKLADQGFPITASVGIKCLAETELKEGAELEVNGRTLKGPAFVWTKTKLYETSFITAGPADDATGVEVMMAESAAPLLAASLAAAPTVPAAPASYATLPPEERAKARLEALKEHETAQAHYVGHFPVDQKKRAREAFRAGTPLNEAMAEALKASHAAMKNAAGETGERARHDESKGRISRGERLQIEKDAESWDPSTKKAAKLSTGDRTIEHLSFGAQTRAALYGDGEAPQRVKELLEMQESKLDRKAQIELVRELWSDRTKEGALLQHVFPQHGGGPELVSAYAKSEWNAALFDAVKAKGLPVSVPYLSRRGTLESYAEKLRELSGGNAHCESLASSWGSNAHSYSVMTVKGFLSYLFKPLEDDVGAGWAQRCAVTIPSSNQQSEVHRWLGNPPQVREWVGNRQTKFMPNYGFTIENLKYEATLDFGVQDFRFDKSGEIQLRMGELGTRMRQHWDVLATNILVTNPTAYDGVALAGTTHTLGGGFTQSNDFSGDGSQGTALAALSVSNATNPTSTEMVGAIMGVIAQLFTFQDQTGSPINGSARRFVVIVPPNLWGPALTAMRAARLNFGQDNPLGLQDYNIDVIPNGWLVTSLVGNAANASSTFWIAREDSMFKSIVFQDVMGWETAMLGPGSDMTVMKDRILFGAKALRGSGPGEWAHIARCKLTT